MASKRKLKTIKLSELDTLGKREGKIPHITWTTFEEVTVYDARGKVVSHTRKVRKE